MEEERGGGKWCKCLAERSRGVAMSSPVESKKSELAAEDEERVTEEAVWSLALNVSIPGINQYDSAEISCEKSTEMQKRNSKLVVMSNKGWTTLIFFWWSSNCQGIYFHWALLHEKIQFQSSEWKSRGKTNQLILRIDKKMVWKKVTLLSHQHWG